MIRRGPTGLQLPEPGMSFYGVPGERDRLVTMAFPAGDDRDGLRAMIDASVEELRAIAPAIGLG